MIRNRFERLGFNQNVAHNIYLDNNGQSKSSFEYLPPGLTFYKDFTTAKENNLSADFSIGLSTSTYTAVRNGAGTSPGTWIDSAGVIQLQPALDNTPRYQYGYYDSTGYHSVDSNGNSVRGLLFEGARTNLLIRTDGTASGSGLWTGWYTAGVAGTKTTTQVAVPELTSIVGSNYQRCQYTGVAGDAPTKTFQLGSTATTAASVADSDILTLSMWIRSQTGFSGVTAAKLAIISKDAASASLTTYSGSDFISSISTEWKYFSYTVTITDDTVDKVVAAFNISGVDENDTLDFEVWGTQLEKASYPSSFIPTTTASLTRNAEVLKYANSGNRTSNNETISMSIIPGWTSAVGITNQVFLNSDNPNRQITNGSDSDFRFMPNNTDSSSSVTAFWTSTFAINTSAVITARCQGTSPYAELLKDGVDINKDETADNFTPPAWGTSFYVGSRNDGTLQINGIVKYIAIHSLWLSTSNVLSEATLLE